MNLPGIFWGGETRAGVVSLCVHTVGFKGGEQVCATRNNKWPYLPRLAEAAHSCSVQAHYDGEEAVEIPQSFAAFKRKKKQTFILRIEANAV